MCKVEVEWECNMHRWSKKQNRTLAGKPLGQGPFGEKNGRMVSTLR
jgi:hypothetical protein